MDMRRDSFKRSWKGAVVRQLKQLSTSRFMDTPYISPASKQTDRRTTAASAPSGVEGRLRGVVLLSRLQQTSIGELDTCLGGSRYRGEKNALPCDPKPSPGARSAASTAAVDRETKRRRRERRESGRYCCAKSLDRQTQREQGGRRRGRKRRPWRALTGGASAGGWKGGRVRPRGLAGGL
jgi:hypothetical protein